MSREPTSLLIPCTSLVLSPLFHRSSAAVRTILGAQRPIASLLCARKSQSQILQLRAFRNGRCGSRGSWTWTQGKLGRLGGRGGRATVDERGLSDTSRALRLMSSSRASCGTRDPAADVLQERLVDVPDDVVRNVKGLGAADGVIGIDIGGTLTKVVFFQPSAGLASTGEEAGSNQLRCQIWPTRLVGSCLAHIQSYINGKRHSQPRISATGGGAIKYAAQLEAMTEPKGTSTPHGNEALFESQDEMVCLAAGLQFLQQSVPGELFSFDSSDMYPMVDTMDLPRDVSNRLRTVTISSEQRPVLLANVGTGTSFVLCPPQNHQHGSAADTEPARRVGGTPLSGSTLLGVLKLLTGKQSYAEILELATQGDSRKVDLTVGDVYGSDYTGVGLSGHRAAGFLARVATDEAFEGAISDDEQPAPYTLADLARSLVFAIGYNIGQQAVLQARVNEAAKEVCFTGSFGSGHPLVMGAIDYAVRMNGGGEFTAAFLKHESFLGAIGAWALGAASR